MQAIILREALIAARKPALVSAAIVSAAVMAMFPVAWGVRGIPTLDGASLYDQQFRLEWIVMLLILPWTAARVIATERSDDLVRLSAATALQPSRVLIARLFAAVLALLLVVAGPLPMVVTAQQMSATPGARVIGDQLALAAFALPTAVIAIWWMQVAGDRLLGWLGAAVTTVTLIVLTRLGGATMDQAAFALATIGSAAAAVLIARADVWWRYLSEAAS